MTSKVQPPAEASTTASAFTGEGWDKVHIEAQRILELPLAVERTEISVTIINDSLATLDSGPNSTLALAYKLLDVEGRELPTDYLKTPLASSVPPRGRVTQKMAISIPEKYNFSAGAIKVGLVQRESVHATRRDLGRFRIRVDRPSPEVAVHRREDDRSRIRRPRQLRHRVQRLLAGDCERSPAGGGRPVAGEM